ncbi:MAG TPA: hypothetical protein VIM79_06850 [Niastella sp.]
MKRTLLSMLALCALVFACKKDKDDDNVNKEALLGKWELKTQYRNVVENNTSKRDTTTYPAGLQITEFLKNDILVLHVRSIAGMKRDTGIYKLDGSNVILTEPGSTKADTMKISKLDGSNLQGYKKFVNSSTRYTEFWLNYKKQ